MAHLLIVILDDLTCMPDLLQVWRTIGVPGTTNLDITHFALPLRGCNRLAPS